MEKAQCPNGCGDAEVTGGHIYTEDGKTYYNVTIVYCPKCLYIIEIDAEL